MKFPVNSIFAASLLLLGLGMQSAAAAKLYKWVDENGVVSYQDTPPPSGSKIVKEEEIDSAVIAPPDGQIISTSTPVIVYTVENCESCDLLLTRLEDWGVPTDEQSLQDREVQAQILQTTESLQAPTLFINDKFVSGLNTSNLKSELQTAGYSIEDSDPDQENENSDTSEETPAN